MSLPRCCPAEWKAEGGERALNVRSASTRSAEISGVDSCRPARKSRRVGLPPFGNKPSWAALLLSVMVEKAMNRMWAMTTIYGPHPSDGRCCAYPAVRCGSIESHVHRGPDAPPLPPSSRTAG